MPERTTGEPPTPAVAPSCPFCDITAERAVRTRAHAVLLWDAHPLHPGHALAVPRRHIGSWFEATEAERADLLALKETPGRPKFP